MARAADFRFNFSIQEKGFERISTTFPVAWPTAPFTSRLICRMNWSSAVRRTSRISPPSD
jgi:hypothetical protein